MNKSYEYRRQEVWIRAWCETARSDNCTSYDIATRFADECLKQFDMRWPKPREQTKQSE